MFNLMKEDSSSKITEESYVEEQSLDSKKNKNSKNNNKASIGSRILNSLQALGKTIQFPIAVLPFAAILNRFGALGVAYTTTTTIINGVSTMHIINNAGYWISYIIQTPGVTMFDNLPLLFAIGIGFGLAKDHRGEAALASVAFFLVTTAFTAEHGLPEMIYGQGKILPFVVDKEHSFSKLFYTPVLDGDKIIGANYGLDTGVFGGIIAGSVTAVLYNKFKGIKLPQVLAFFGGRRFVPMLAIAIAIPVAFIYAIIWPWIQLGLVYFAQNVSSSSATYGAQVGGVFVFGLLNRFLLAFGLHMVLNAILWFQIPISGPHINPGFHWSNAMVGSSMVVNGDINAFTSGVYGSGNFQSGFFPIMMGGLPAAVIAMIFVAPKENRSSVAGFLGGAAVISFLTGVTEPIEYSFIFLSPVLLVAHALFSGISNAIVVAMQMHVGFGFSAGFIDYAISIPQSWAFSLYQLHSPDYTFGHTFGVTGNPLFMLPLIALFFALYFFSFTFLIKKLDIKTPGREKDYVVTNSSSKTDKSKNDLNADDKYVKMAKEIIEAIGLDNIEVIDNCATRLRLELKNNTNVDTKRIKLTGVFGIKTLGTKSLQIIVGTDVEHVANAMHDLTNK